jgi:hypothetical protein
VIPGRQQRRKTTIDAELAEHAEKLIVLCEFCGFCVDRRGIDA